MVRIAVAVTFVLIINPQFLVAEPESDPRVGRALAVQTAMNTAKDHLREHRPALAVAVLEAEILYVNGNGTFLALMKDAYMAQLKDLKQKNAGVDQIDHVVRQLRILDPKLNPDDIKSSPSEAVVSQLKPVAQEKPRNPVVRFVSEEEDPFQQTPIDRMEKSGTNELKVIAANAFNNKRYAEAATHFARAAQAKIELTASERTAWAYCRLNEVVLRLNEKKEDASSVAALEKEAGEAVKLGGPSLDAFGKKVLAEIEKRKSSAKPAAAIPEGWQTVETGSFRVFYRQSRDRAAQFAKFAEQIRTATFEKWAGPAGGGWTPRCDLWLHASGAEYVKATEKPATSPGHSSVGIKDGKVHNRRIDLRLDDSSTLDITLPREVAYVVVTDLFPEQSLPRWADVGMAILAEPAVEVSRYLRAMPRLAKDKKLFSVRDLLKLAEFPEAERITPFYVQSVSLIDYLVHLKGAKAFALYLREAPRRGYEEALQRHYGFKDANELQERWMKYAMGAE